VLGYIHCYLISTQLILRERDATTTCRILPLVQSVGVKIFRICSGYQIRFRLGLRYEAAYSAPQTLAGFKVREGKGRRGGKGGAVASEAIWKWGGTMPARSAGRKFFDVPPHFSLVHPPHEGAQRLFVTD